MLVVGIKAYISKILLCMDKIRFLKHCTGKPVDLLKDGYIRSASDLGIEAEWGDPTKIFTQIVIKNYEKISIRWHKCCLILDKKILIERKDYAINSTYHGFVTKDSAKSKTITDKLIDRLDPQVNEVMYSNKISLKKYLIGIRIWVIVSHKNDERLDLIDTLTKSRYISQMKKNGYDGEKSLEKAYPEGKGLLKLMRSWTDNVNFDIDYSVVAPAK